MHINAPYESGDRLFIRAIASVLFGISSIFIMHHYLFSITNFAKDNFDVTVSLSIATSGAFDDAQGDRIPVFELGEDSSTTLNGLFKVGVDLTPDQRLQFTFNYFYDRQNPDVISEPIVDELPGMQKARALEVGDLEFVDTPSPGNENTIINVAYNNENILGSRLQGQIY